MEELLVSGFWSRLNCRQLATSNQQLVHFAAH
jgi:hypothetical protein